jgi:predicted chitinase
VSFRTVYGNTHSENGWPMVDQGSCEWVRIPGAAHVSLQIQKGWPLAILRAFAADWNAYIEPLRDPDSACWTPTNDVPTSNHLSGTAMDCNWNSHPFKVSYAGFNQTQIATMREMLDFYEGTVFWGQDWNSPKDPMHAQVGYNTFNNPHTEDFIRRKIRADGFSTFRRGNAAQPDDAALVLSRATGLDLNRATEILPTMQQGLKQADCTNVNRIAMFIAQTGHESANFQRTEEYASGAAYEGRTDLGNTQPGDGVRFKGRTWIQITGRHNYGKFSQWAHSRGLVPSPTYFVDHPVELQDMKWAGIGAAWYWTVARGTRINEASDRRDIVTVTQLINGGQNGIDDRRLRYNRALAVGDDLLHILNGGDDFLSALNPDEQREVLNLLRVLADRRYNSRSGFRKLNSTFTETVAGYGLNTDGSQHVQLTIDLARMGDPESIELIAEIASALGDPRYPDRQLDAQRAALVLRDLENNYRPALESYLAMKGRRP